MSGPESHLLTLACRYGGITFPRHDSVIGKSLRTYGEWAQSEVELLRELVSEGGTVVDAGAFIGTHTLALAQKVGPQGRVVSVEAQPAIRALLRENVECNGLQQVELVEAALADRPGRLRFPRLDLELEANFAGVRAIDPGCLPESDNEILEVEATTLDELGLGRVDLIKADLEGMEVPMLEGAVGTLEGERPHLYLECSSVSNGLRILEFLRARDYRAYMHRAPAFNPDNFFASQERIFGLARETSILAIAGGRLEEMAWLPRRHPDLAPVGTLDELALLLLSTARWGEPEWSSLTKPSLIARITRLLEEQDRLEHLLREAQLDQEAARRSATEALGEVEALRARHAARAKAVAQEIESIRLRKAEEDRQARHWIESLESRVSELVQAKNGLEIERQIASKRWQEADDRATRLAAELSSAPANRGEPTGPVVADLQTEHPWLVDVVRRLFDEQYYLDTNPDAARQGGDALGHFLETGGRQGCDPLALFDSSFYLDCNPDVRDSGIDPLLHYVAQGALERRDPHPLFSTSYYLSQAPAAGEGANNPLQHYVTDGYRAGVDPHPLFRTRFYLQQAPECDVRRTNPLVHYLTIGAWKGLDPHPMFDSSFYLSRHTRLRASGLDPLSHFLVEGAADGADPHPFFSCEEYRLATPPTSGATLNPLVHFVTRGRSERRRPKEIFDLARDKFLLTDLDRLRHDGRRVVLLVSRRATGPLHEQLHSLAKTIAERCVALHLRPADHHLLGEATRELLALSPLATDGPGLLFDPRSQIGILATVLRGVGVTRVDLHQPYDERGYLRPLLDALALPFDVTLHELRISPPIPTLSGIVDRFRTNPETPARSRLFKTISGIAALGVSRGRTGGPLDRAGRIFAPSVSAARRIAELAPTADILAVMPPASSTRDAPSVDPPSLRSDRPLRVAVVEEVGDRCGQMIRACVAHAADKHLPLELHVVDPPVPEAAAALPPTPYTSALRAGLRRIAPDLVWLVAERPAAHSSALTAVLAEGLPLMVPNLGDLPERVGGRPWTWVLPPKLGAKGWCRHLCGVREQLVAGLPPTPPDVLETADADFYPNRYLDVEGLA